MLQLCTEIARSLGRLEGQLLFKPEPQLRKSNRARTIHASLAIEGNTLAFDQVTALFEGKRVLGPRREILEVHNAIQAYERLSSYKPFSSKSLKEAHGILMDGLAEDAGKWRTTNVGIFRGSQVMHAAPQAKRVPELMPSLFRFVKSDKETHALILSAVFHHELEFIHPFSDGNGRLGRLWQTALLTKFHPIFEFTPLESAVRERQSDYDEALGRSDQAGDSSTFVEFSLQTILHSLEDLSASARAKPLSATDRLEVAREAFHQKPFSRKEYLELFKSISTATASRDLALGVRHRTIRKSGDKALATYRFKR